MNQRSATLTPGSQMLSAVPGGGLANRGFLGLLVTQFLGAMNDNIFRWLVVPIGTDLFTRLLGDEKQARSLATSLGATCLVLPFVLLAAPAGYLADRFSKRSVIVHCKLLEVVAMLLGVAAIGWGNIYALFLVVFLLGIQSALFGPSKLGSIPELVRSEKISSANGLVGMTTVIAIVAGSVIGNRLYGWSWSPESGLVRLWLPAAVLVGVAAAGWLASLAIQPLPGANPRLRFPRNPVAQTWRDLASIAESRPLLRAAVGIALFWSVAALAQVNVNTFALEHLRLDQGQVGTFLAVLAAGVGIGSVLAGIWSAGRVELGIVPLGALLIAVNAILLFTSTPSEWWFGLWLFLLGAGGGLFDIPLAAYMQHRSPIEKRGAILAATNFLTFGGTLLSTGLFYVLREELGMGSEHVFLVTGIGMLVALVYIVMLLPGATVRFVVWLATRTIYRLRVFGHDNLPQRGGALLVANHVTWLDGVFLLLSSSRPIRLVASAERAGSWWLRGLSRLMGVISLKRESIAEAVDAARRSLRQGELVCIFPEGGLTRTGQLQSFRPDLLAIAEGTTAPVVPVYLDELWGSIFSYEGGRLFWKWPRRWPYPVSIHFGHPLAAPVEAPAAERAVERLAEAAVEQRRDRKMILPRAFLRTCRRNFFRVKLVDSTGAELTGAGMLLKTLVFRRLLAKLLAPDERFVGLLLPPSTPAVLANAALPLDGRVGVNLNYTVSADVMNSCIAQCGIRRVLTSHKVMEKLHLKIDAELVYLEDLAGRVTAWDKLVAALATYLLPVFVLERWLGLHKLRGDDLLTVIFTSGSTGEPKGVMLSHQNVASNVEAMDQVVHISKSDVAIGVLPFFHSYGYTATLWTVLALDPKGIYHFSPLDGRQVGKLSGKHRTTLLMSTPTFLRLYLKSCQPEDFASLDVVFASAEKLPVELSNAFEEKFGVRPVEAYGATELSPLVSVNVPATRAAGGDDAGCKEGTVGRPIPGVMAKVVHPETGVELGRDEPGLLLIKGPNVMQGYFNRPDLTAKVMRDGWYVTGDIALIDSDGFIRITGRESRFSKIGGEMVPHIMIEETLQKIVSTDEEELKAVVTAVPDAKKGERLVVLHTALEKSPAAICKELSESGLPNLWIPSPDSFFLVEHIPVLGTGKLDLKAVKDLAREKVGAGEVRAR